MDPKIGKVLFLVNAFPSPDNIHKSPFNFRALKSLIAAGVDVHAVHLRSWAPGRKKIQRYQLDGVPVTAVCFPFYVKLPRSLAALNLWLYKKLFVQNVRAICPIDEIRIIHSVGAGHAGVVGSELSKRFNLPHIVQCIGSDINLVIPSMKNAFGVKDWDKQVDCFSCNSIELGNQVKSLYPSAQTTVIYRGVNLQEFYPDYDARQPGSLAFTYIGGFTPKETKPFGLDQKGGVTVLKAWKLVREELPDAAIRLRFCGPSAKPETVAAHYPGQIDGSGVEVVGQLSKTQVCPMLQSSDVVIIPSMFEGLPNAAMEASATGAALIGSRVGGIPEVIRDGQTGLLVERNNARELADKIKMLITNGGLAAQMGRAGRTYMEERFDSAQFAQGYINLYGKMISSK